MSDKKTRAQIKREMAQFLAHDLEPGGASYIRLMQYYNLHDEADEAVRSLRLCVDRLSRPLSKTYLR